MKEEIKENIFEDLGPQEALMPEREVWLHKNEEAKKSVLRGLKQAKEMPKCTRNHEPNEETQMAFKEEAQKTFESVDEFWDAMGMNPRG